jgi:hypothetical protein
MSDSIKELEDGVVAIDMSKEIDGIELQNLIEMMTLNTMRESYMSILFENGRTPDEEAYKDANKRMAKLFSEAHQWEKYKEQIWQWFDDLYANITQKKIKEAKVFAFDKVKAYIDDESKA